MQTERHCINVISWKHSGTLLFLAVSTLLHAGVLVFFQSHLMKYFSVKLPTNTGLQIALLDNSHQISITGAKIRKDNSAVKRNTYTVVKKIPEKPNLTQKAVDINHTLKTNLVNSNAANSDYLKNPSQSHAKKIDNSTDIKKRLLKRVDAEIKKYIIYPDIARKRGWEGLVMIGFQFSDAGLIRNVHLFKSSGFPILDQSALNAFQQISHIQFMDTIPTKSSKILHVPIEFQLIEG